MQPAYARCDSLAFAHAEHGLTTGYRVLSLATPLVRNHCYIMNIRCGHLIVALLFGAIAAGCLGPRRDDYQSICPITFPDRSPEAQRLWGAIEETLRRNRFRLDRVDARAGVITTMPVTSQHLYEFWRHDVDTWPDALEATLNPLRRWVEVSVTLVDDRMWSELAVVVHKERLSSPDRQFNSTVAAYQYFGDSLPSTTGLVRVTPEHDLWLDLGRDPAMEDYLLRTILERAGLEQTGSGEDQTPPSSTS